MIIPHNDHTTWIFLVHFLYYLTFLRCRIFVWQKDLLVKQDVSQMELCCMKFLLSTIQSKKNFNKNQLLKKIHPNCKHMMCFELQCTGAMSCWTKWQFVREWLHLLSVKRQKARRNKCWKPEAIWRHLSKSRIKKSSKDYLLLVSDLPGPFLVSLQYVSLLFG